MSSAAECKYSCLKHGSLCHVTHLLRLGPCSCSPTKTPPTTWSEAFCFPQKSWAGRNLAGAKILDILLKVERKSRLSTRKSHRIRTSKTTEPVKWARCR